MTLSKPQLCKKKCAYPDPDLASKIDATKCENRTLHTLFSTKGAEAMYCRPSQLNR